MIIESQVKRFWLRMLLLGILVDAAIAFGLAWAFVDKDERLITAGFLWLCIQALSVLMGLRSLLHAGAAWHIGQAKMVEDGFLGALRERSFPQPGPYETSVASYLERIVQDDEVPQDKRIAAAALAGSKETLRQIGFIRAAMFEAAHERALKRYTDQSQHYDGRTGGRFG
jgi:hypothetical protein